MPNANVADVGQFAHAHEDIQKRWPARLGEVKSDRIFHDFESIAPRGQTSPSKIDQVIDVADRRSASRILPDIQMVGLQLTTDLESRLQGGVRFAFVVRSSKSFDFGL